LAAEFREVYPEFEAKVVGLLNRMAANDAEISNLHIARSAGVKLHLLEAELVARGLEQFTRDMPSITKELTSQASPWPGRVDCNRTRPGSRRCPTIRVSPPAGGRLESGSAASKSANRLQ
jgi:hypothetical protein